jgi:hypothetical protein
LGLFDEADTIFSYSTLKRLWYLGYRASSSVVARRLLKMFRNEEKNLEEIDFLGFVKYELTIVNLTRNTERVSVTMSSGLH